MAKNKNCESTDTCSRLGKVGGQAVLEGVMMKAGTHTVTTCRKEDGTLAVTDSSFVSVRDKYKILNLPVLRGVVNFIEMMALSVKTLGASADAMGLDEEENPGKFEKWMAEKLGMRLTDLIMVISVILGLALSVLLFLFLPIWITAGINLLLDVLGAMPMGAVATAIVEGLVKIGIFVSYLYLVSLMPDIKRTFMYHGAEHKSIACFESGDELTPAAAAKHKRFHPRCGTSFMFFMILLGIFAGVILKTTAPALAANTLLYSLVRLLILPLLMGVGYEFIRFAGKHDNIFTRILSAPGLWVQRITTKEPTEDMLEVAIISLKCALRDEYPEFLEFYESRPWEPEVNKESEEDSEGAAESDDNGNAGENMIADDATASEGKESENLTVNNESYATAEAKDNTEGNEPFTNASEGEGCADGSELSPPAEEENEAEEGEKAVSRVEFSQDASKASSSAEGSENEIK